MMRCSGDVTKGKAGQWWARATIPASTNEFDSVFPGRDRPYSSFESAAGALLRWAREQGATELSINGEIIYPKNDEAS
jgi:hypothetical protein